MKSITQYGVKFIGYGAYVLANKKGVEIDCGHLDFVSGCASLKANGGWVIAPNRDELGPFVNSLPKIVGELEDLLKELPCRQAAPHVKGLCCDQTARTAFSEGSGFRLRHLPEPASTYQTVVSDNSSGSW